VAAPSSSGHSILVLQGGEANRWKQWFVRAEAWVAALARIEITGQLAPLIVAVEELRAFHIVLSFALSSIMRLRMSASCGFDDAQPNLRIRDNLARSG
jgi:hypothetical protein